MCNIPEKRFTELVAKQHAYFDTGATLSLSVRREALTRLREALIENEAKIAEAIKSDLGKSAFESYMCETGLCTGEISYLLKNLSRFAKEKTVITPLAQFPSRSYKKPSPYGVTLIMSPWNYPLLLTLDPLANALAAGNTAVVKPSAYSPATSALIASILGEIFPEEYVSVVTGGREENKALLDEKFDFIFFTGSKAVGRTVLSKAAPHLTPCVLELGGKSPCIVDETADIRLSARRIVWGKFLNLGQTCVAPDYILCHERVKDELIDELKAQIKGQIGNYFENPDYGKIINEKHFERILGLINPEKVVCGGGSDKASLKIEPTLMDGVTREDAVMKEEIFGPVLPVLAFSDIDEVIEQVNGGDTPLALYIFSRNKGNIKKVTERCAFGGGCVNDTIIHLATSYMGFGGMGESGMGQYHGRAGFDCFSHEKSIVDKKLWLDLPMRYQPYNPLYGKLLHMFLR